MINCLLKKQGNSKKQNILGGRIRKEEVRRREGIGGEGKKGWRRDRKEKEKYQK